MKTAADTSAAVRFAAQADPEESRLEALSAADISIFTGIAQVIRWTPGTSLRGTLTKERTGTEFWLAFAVLALCAAVADTVLGNRYSRSK